MADAVIKHAFVSGFTDGSDATKLRPSNWNAALVLTAGSNGDLLTRDSASATGASWAAPAVVTAGSLSGTTLAASIVNSSLVTFGSGPTLITPIIASFLNANHSHLNAAGGGLLTTAAISGFGTATFTAPTLGAAIATSLVLANGTKASPSFSFNSEPTTGLYWRSAGLLSLAAGSKEIGQWGGSYLAVLGGLAIGAVGSDLSTTSPTTFLLADATNTLAQRNGTGAQTFNLYNTYTDASNYERLGIKFAANVITFASEAAGTGTARSILMALGPPGSYFNISAASGATAVISISPFSTDAYFDNSANGGFIFRNGGSTELFRITTAATRMAGGLFQFNGATSAFPALKRSSTTLQVRLADDSGDAPISVGTPFTVKEAGTTVFAVATTGGEVNAYAGYRVNAALPLLTQAGLYLSGATNTIAWAASFGASLDLFQYRDAANTLAQRNSTSAQTYNLYETYTDASNYSRLSISAPAGGPITFASQALGTGTARTFRFTASGGSFNIDQFGRALGTFITSDNISGAFYTTGLVMKSTLPILWSNGTNYFDTNDTGIVRNAAGIVEINNGTPGTLRDLALRSLIGVSSVIGIGGTTSAFPALKRSGTTLAVRLADDSGDAPLSALSVTAPTLRSASGVDLAVIGGGNLTGLIRFKDDAGNTRGSIDMAGGAINAAGAFTVGGTSLQLSLLGLDLFGSGYITWRPTNGGTQDLFLYRDAANILAHRNGTNAQTVRLYETYTDASNYSRLSISAPAGGPITFASEAAGTGTARDINIVHPNGGAVNVLKAAGNYTILRVGTDSTHAAAITWDGSGGRFQTSGLAYYFYFDGSEIGFTTNGGTERLRITSSGLLTFGGVSSSYPALKRSSAILQGRLADDSAFCQLQGKLTTDANATTGLTAGVLAATTNATITITDASGQVYRVPCII